MITKLDDAGYPVLPDADSVKALLGISYKFDWNHSPKNPASRFSDWQLRLARAGWKVVGIYYYNGTTIPYDHAQIVRMENG